MAPKEEEMPDREDFASEKESEEPIESKEPVSPCVTCTTHNCEECDHRVGLDDVAAVSGNLAGKMSRMAYKLGKSWTSGFLKGFRDE